MINASLIPEGIRSSWKYTSFVFIPLTILCSYDWINSSIT
jgi:hypothetical protein